MKILKIKGFTLIELLTVLSIVSIFSTVVLTDTLDARDRAKDAVRVSDITQLALAMEINYDQRQRQYQVFSNTTPQSVGTDYPEVPENNAVNDGVYGWISNTGDPSRYCAWATLKKERYDGLYFVASEIGAGYLDEEPTNFDECAFFEEQKQENGLESGQSKKVKVCKTTSTGKKKTLNIGKGAKDVHLNKGATEGECEPG